MMKKTINISLGFENWFHRKCDDGSRMWAFSTPTINFVKSNGGVMINLMIFFWDLTIEIKH